MKFKAFLQQINEDLLSNWYWKESIYNPVENAADFYLFSLFQTPEQLEKTKGITIDLDQYGRTIQAFFDGKKKCYEFLKDEFIYYLYRIIEDRIDIDLYDLIDNIDDYEDKTLIEYAKNKLKELYKLKKLGNKIKTIKFIKDIHSYVMGEEDPWVEICDTFIQLYKAKTVDEKQVWIDNVYNLQHHNGSIFEHLYEDRNKVREINNFLDFKLHNNDPEKLLEYCSANIQKIGKIMLNIYGI